MKKIVNFDFSERGIKEAQEEINNIIKSLEKNVNIEFIRLSLEWIKNKAISYLKTSGFESELIQEIQGSFKIETFVQLGKLILEHKKGAYLEFGIGITGSQENYPRKFATNLDWEYNKDSKYKKKDGSWYFGHEINMPLDLKKENIANQIQQNKENRITIKTYGQTGTLFMYNAIMDYANNIEIPIQLYREALTKFIGG